MPNHLARDFTLDWIHLKGEGILLLCPGYHREEGGTARSGDGITRWESQLPGLSHSGRIGTAAGFNGSLAIIAFDR
jgi:hypothetical protein